MGRGKRGSARGKGRRAVTSEEPIELIIYGVHPVEEYLKVAPESVDEILVSRESLSEEIERAVSAHGIRVKRQEREELDERANARNHQGVVLVGRPYEYASFEGVLEAVAEKPRALVLVLDQIQDAGNLGAILRSAAGFGVDAVVIPKDRSARVTGAVVRASAGQAMKLKVAQVTNLGRALDALSEVGFWRYGAFVDLERSKAPWDHDFAGTKVALVMGSEHAGLRVGVAKRCDFVVEIPMSSGVESLNVSAASSVVLYEIFRQWSQRAE